MQDFSSLDGAILIDKPVGPTSHDVVDAIRRRFQIKKVGHCGTLDPNATGLLIIVLGRGTKLSEKLMGDDKVYEGTIKFGETTDSYDSDGELTASLPVPMMTLEQLNEEAGKFIGDQLQVPPMVSAIKKNGVPLYKLARKGIEVVREPRLIHIYNFRFTDYTEPLGQFRVACTKGTYVRSIAHDLGQKLGCGAHLATLRRSVSGKFDVADSTKFDDVMNLTAAELEKKVLPFLKLAAGT
jgi:tRNA pseudouridine55 synthase